jgi:hypothetical protein
MKTIKLKLTKAQITMLQNVLTQFDLHIEDSQDNYNALTKRELRSYNILEGKIYRELTK